MARRRVVPMWTKGSKAGSKRYADRRREHELGENDGTFDQSIDGVTAGNQAAVSALGGRLSRVSTRLEVLERRRGTLPRYAQRQAGLGVINDLIIRC